MTGRTTMPAVWAAACLLVLTGCAATPEAGQSERSSDETVEHVTVQEIAGVPMTTAVWGFDGLLVRRGASLPAFTDGWYGKPTCDSSGPFRLVGRWLGVVSEKKVRFDGDLRPPLWIDLHVEPGRGSPRELQRYTLRIHDEGDAAPGLDKHMAEEALWSDRSDLDVQVVCEGDRFVARSFSLLP